MSKIILQSSNTGIGNITINAPVTNTDRTFVLPDDSGSILTTSGGTMTGPLAGFTSTGIVDNATATSLTIDSAGRVLMPSQPAFLAGKNDNANLVAAGTYIFDDIYINVGSHYSPSTGRFTAPVTGTYWVSATMQTYGAAVGSQAIFGFFKNGVLYPSDTDTSAPMRSITDKTGAVGYHNSPSLTGLIPLSVGDYVYVGVLNANTLRGMQSHFSGFLIG